tara:strand:- start:1492 stop:2247 length:756 start_codon:yes stop_codon:yes gene_type:complete
MHFKIIVPFYNVEPWIRTTIRSMKLQDYSDFQCILVDDMSTDNTNEIIMEEIAGDNRFVLITNSVKKYVLQNVCYAIDASNPEKEDVIVILDGDDWFARKNTLSILADSYDAEDCWLTYGSYMEYPSKIRGKFATQVSPDIVSNNAFRDSPWQTSHLRSWKYGLWQHIDQHRSFREPNPIEPENHFSSCWDLAYMFPLLELAGSKIHHISEILYVYNRQNPLNVDKIKHQTQLKMEQKIRNMLKYKPLEKL